MQLVDNWRAVLRRAWSVRLMGLAIALTGAEAALTLFGYDLPLPEWAAAGIVGLVSALALLMRILAQHNMRDQA